MNSLKFKHRISELIERSKYIDITLDEEYKYNGNKQHALGFMFGREIGVSLFKSDLPDGIRAIHIVELNGKGYERALGLTELYDIDLVELVDLDILIFREYCAGFRRITRIYSNGEYESFKWDV